MEPGVQFTFGSNNIAQQELLGPRVKWKFTHRDTTHPTLLQISDSIFAVNCLDPYPGWEKIKATLMYAWPKFRKEAQPAQITRIGLRYIKSEAHERRKTGVLAQAHRHDSSGTFGVL
jgi:uncharacterized protein (TIGR04255 family)